MQAMLLTKSTPLTYTTACMNCKAPTTVSVSLDVNAPTSVSEQMMPPDHKPYLAQPANYSTPTKPVWQRHNLKIAKTNRHLVKDKGASWDPQKGVWWINLDVNTGMTDSDWCFDAFSEWLELPPHKIQALAHPTVSATPPVGSTSVWQAASPAPLAPVPHQHLPTTDISDSWRQTWNQWPRGAGISEHTIWP